MTIDEQIEVSKNYLAKYRDTQVGPDASVTQWFTAVIASLESYRDLVGILTACPACGGTGAVQVTDVEWDTCSRCGGTGKIKTLI